MDASVAENLLGTALPALAPEVMRLNDSLAANPEIGGEEVESVRRITELLRSRGLEVEVPFAGLDTAFRARINPEAPRRAALLAEYDALPEVGHACGHCASGSASVLAFLALHELRDRLDFGIDLIGTPDEEMLGRKCDMADAGIFDGYDFAAMVHMAGQSTVEADFIALDARTFRFLGAPAHAAQAPELGRNALNAARLFFDATDMMRQHIIPEARLHGIITKGGTASNVVPELAEVQFLSRAPRRKDLGEITAWVEDCARAAALATRCECEIEELSPSFHELYVSKPGAALMYECFEELGLPLATEGSTSGSSDIGNVDYRCPAFHPMMGIGQNLAVHTHEFSAAMTDERTHEAIRNAASLLLLMVTKLYADPARLEEVRAAHKAYRGL